ncbi:MAG: ribonuclease HII [Actinomycetia bacterium]|nr:ribonuclease HII [Actinomycetes bacterium]
MPDLSPTGAAGVGALDYEALLHEAGFARVAGADEAGRGAYAGPLVAAAVILPADRAALDGLRDSKALSAPRREAWAARIRDGARAWAVVRVEADECDRLGIQEADLQGLRRALLRLEVTPDFVLTDGFPVPGLPCPALALWKGDQVAACVSAASILAKVERDAIMLACDDVYPGYGFARHKGYGTASHQRALRELGPCPLHRRSFDPVAAAMRP